MVTPLVLILARLFGRKAVVQAHGLDVIHASGFYQTVCVRWLRFCDRIIANSIYTESLVAEKMTRPGVTSVIPPGVDPIRFEVGAFSGIGQGKIWFGRQANHSFCRAPCEAKRR